MLLSGWGAPVSGRQAALPAFPRSGVLAGVVALIAPLIDAAGIDRRYYEESPILCSCSAQDIAFHKGSALTKLRD